MALILTLPQPTFCCREQTRYLPDYATSQPLWQEAQSNTMTTQPIIVNSRWRGKQQTAREVEVTRVSFIPLSR